MLQGQDVHVQHPPLPSTTPSPVPQKHTPLTQQVLHKLLLPSSPCECTHTRTHKLRPGQGSEGSFFSTQVIFNHGWWMRRLFSLWKVLEQHCVFTQLYTLPPCFSSPDLCYHVPGRNLIKWHRASRYLFPSLHLPSLSRILIVRLAGLDYLSSHQRGHTFGLPSLTLPQHLPCHLFCCRNGKRTGRSDSISYILRLMYRTGPSRSRGRRGGRVVQREHWAPLSCNFLLPAHPLLLPHWSETFGEDFLAPCIVKTHFR